MKAIASIDELPGSYLSPALISAFREDEALDVAKSVAPAISRLLSSSDKSAVDTLFYPDAFWRDQVSLSWSLRTLHPTSVISETIIPLIQRAEIEPSSIVLQEGQVRATQLPNGVSVVRAPFAFRTSKPAALCSAAFKLIRMKNGDIKVFTVTTSLKELDAMPWRALPLAIPVEIPPTVPKSLDVLVVGGGHGGLALSAYLKALSVNFAMVEKLPSIGDSWSKRYDSATLHTTRIFSGLPFISFPSDYPEFVPAKLIARYYAKYVQDLQLPAYPGHECVSATWDDAQARWTVTLDATHGTEVVSVRNLVFAVGTGGRLPIIPDFPGRDTFQGESLHSVTYKNAASWAGKRVAVVGAAATACDVAHDCARAGADTVMVQRSPTRVYPPGHVSAVLGVLYNTETPLEVGDTRAGEDPIVLQAEISAIVLGRLKDRHDPEYYDSLRRAGFLVTADGSTQEQTFCRGGTHYPDIGACGAISRGEIKVKSGTKIESITPTGIAFADGTTLDVDVIVYATGFEKDSRRSIAAVVGAEQAATLEPVWGLDLEGEVRGCWRPTGNDHIWFQGGEMQTMRYYGKFLAMQVAAEVAKVRPVPCRR
ncbi:hypothetical protein B0H17DRAFT_365221 [Mycena rosella]|uniref:FAD/NAD(P)-binding domain-containing protein n=1 Tax=Mycena rosella TaxID=1033263 RepID=A0AAD7MB55_MYCRO|nr:hypothetical protein B0H17DRAFT_365221 [Mycena rosella]